LIRSYLKLKLDPAASEFQKAELSENQVFEAKCGATFLLGQERGVENFRPE
jgi:hypothetical protein